MRANAFRKAAVEYAAPFERPLSVEALRPLLAG